MPKHPLLVVGQKVWLETTNRHGNDVRFEDDPCEMVVIKVNKTSAYIASNEASKMHYQVNQKTHQVKYSIPNGRTYRFWLSIEAYKNHAAYEKEKSELAKAALKKIGILTLEELRAFVAVPPDGKRE